MTDRRFRHNLDLCHTCCTVTIGCSYAVASGIAAADDENFLAFTVDDTFGRDDDTFQKTVLLSQQFEGEMDAFQVTAIDR